MTRLGVFISHDHADAGIANAWKQLIGALSGGRIDVWFSSDQKLDGGMGMGEWLPQLIKQLLEAEHVLMLITPSSNERPWLAWEAGAASSQGKTIVPVHYFMRDEEAVHKIHRSNQSFDGEDVANVKRVCGGLMKRAGLGRIADEEWEAHFEKYSAIVRDEWTRSIRRRLFYDHFHDHIAAKEMSEAGTWHTVWSQVNDDGTETIFETDEVEVLLDGGERIRLLGRDTKPGREKYNKDGSLDYYPMEGVISSDGRLAISYWNAGSAKFCGTALMKREGLLIHGHWSGFEAERVSGIPRYTSGRVIMMQDKEELMAEWEEMKRSGGS